MKVAVGFSPRSGRHWETRRVSDALSASHFRGFHASLTRRHDVADSIRGLKSTATIESSLRDCKKLRCELLPSGAVFDIARAAPG